jgi:DNA-directed RNA polymerase subunit RPC12/RpoP
MADSITCPHCSRQLKIMKYLEDGIYTIATDSYSDYESEVLYFCPECGKEVDYKPHR